VPVLVSSDAHYMSDIANMDHVEAIIEETEFPEELIINYSKDQFKEFIRENRKACSR
jgi:putative hydrolase